MSRAVLIQQVYRGSEYVDALTLTYARHLKYCQKFDMDYLTIHGNVVEKWDMKFGGWAKVALMFNALLDGYDKVIWLDADCLIADLNTDLCEACPEHGIGCVLHTPNGRPPVYNVGCLYTTNSERTQFFFNEWLGWYPGPVDGWHEQGMFNLLSQIPHYGGLIVPVDKRWNSCVKGETHVENAVVEGFHGEGEPAKRIQLMREWLMREQVNV